MESYDNYEFWDSCASEYFKLNTKEAQVPHSPLYQAHKRNFPLVTVTLESVVIVSEVLSALIDHRDVFGAIIGRDYVSLTAFLA